jgi:hypothetical protein
VREKIRRGISVKRVRVSAFLPEWLVGKVDVKPSTLRGYRIHVDKYLVPMLGHRTLDELRVSHVARSAYLDGGARGAVA